MNRGQLKTRVSRMIGLSTGTSGDELDESALLDELANEAVIDILSRTAVHVRRTNIVLTAGFTEYDIDAAVLRIWGIKRGENWLQEQDVDSFDEYGYAFLGHNRIMLGAQGTGDSLLVMYVPLPTPMTADTHDPALQTYGLIPVQFHRAIINYMCWHAADKAGDVQAQRGERYRVLYEGQDGMGSIGSDLGRIKLFTNMRGGAVRVTRYRETLRSDVSSQHWIG
jgi:hypothetical protein